VPLAPLALAALLAQNDAAPVLAPDWKPAPPQPQEYRRYVRAVAHAPAEELFGKLQVCDCDPSAFVGDLVHKVIVIPKVLATRGTVIECDTTAQHLVVTGLSDGRRRKNFDLYAYRSNGALVVIEYAYTKADPDPGDERAMQALCATDADRAAATNGTGS
jgi:hypothetical protein